jgi:hypothetical protein
VLARLPDVSGQPPIDPRSARAAAGFVDYRFDLPAGSEASIDHGRADAPRKTTQPHMFQRSSLAEQRSRPFGSRSRVLPDSNPFSIPAISLLDRLAPVGRFLVLFVLFTAVGTFLLSSRREEASSEPGRPRPRSASSPSGVRQSLEPALPRTEHPSIATPSAFGPLGSNAKSTTHDPPSTVEVMESVEVPQTPAPRLARVDGDLLPQVQTTDWDGAHIGGEDAPARLSRATQPEDPNRPPAMARLPGTIEAPRNTYHDSHQPGLY